MGVAVYNDPRGVCLYFPGLEQRDIVVEVDVCIPMDQLKAIEHKTKFDIEGHSLTLFGRYENYRVQ